MHSIRLWTYIAGESPTILTGETTVDVITVESHNQKLCSALGQTLSVATTRAVESHPEKASLHTWSAGTAGPSRVLLAPAAEPFPAPITSAFQVNPQADIGRTPSPHGDMDR